MSVNAREKFGEQVGGGRIMSAEYLNERKPHLRLEKRLAKIAAQREWREWFPFADMKEIIGPREEDRCS